jgi:hypothetical protein
LNRRAGMKDRESRSVDEVARSKVLRLRLSTRPEDVEVWEERVVISCENDVEEDIEGDGDERDMC